MSSNQTKPSDTIVIYPSPGIGHLTSAVELGKLLHCRYSHRYSITVLLTTGLLDSPSTSSFIASISNSFPSISFIRFPPLDLSTLPSTTDVSRAAVAFEFIRRSTAESFRRSLLEISSSGAVVRAVVLDLFCSSAFPICRELGFPTFYFYTSGAASLAGFLYFPKIFDDSDRSFKDQPGVVIEFPAGLPALKATEMPEPTLDRDDPAFRDFHYFCTHMAKSDGILINTFEELEPRGMQDLLSGACVPSGPTPPIYCIGPLIVGPETRSGDRKGDLSYMSWLEEQPRESVVFLCFGSKGSFPTSQIEAIAEGLEKSGHRFLWVLKAPIAGDISRAEVKREVDLGTVLPSGFLERTRGRGQVVEGWTPQVSGGPTWFSMRDKVEVLEKGSVGGFVTHCGWNSVLETVMAGVPMIAWPLYAEQHMNRNILVEDMKIAVPVKQRDGDGFVSREEVERAVRELMDGEKGREVRERSLKMRTAAMEALGESGSSTRNLAKLAELFTT